MSDLEFIIMWLWERGNHMRDVIEGRFKNVSLVQWK